ncbi:serine/threonine-protein kinase/endoribonuclease IRE1-like [Humulus lupulus]|uniref:serine/threonine-protein kinase/endoribonuclease IRE1-like n=1 Tax=Humulus lupulus TaxID=3486 RepID=UPI002B401E4A|nr:serine/threonine-protein kinase/endoribonuclease IRE1-like [Humulus lupulus]
MSQIHEVYFGQESRASSSSSSSSSSSVMEMTNSTDYHDQTVIATSTTSTKTAKKNYEAQSIWYILWNKFWRRVRCWKCNEILVISEYDHQILYLCNLGELIQKQHSGTATNELKQIKLTNQNGRPTSICLKFVRNLCGALVGLHKSGKIHGNLNPGNVLIKKEIKGFRAELANNSFISSSSYHSTDCGKFGWEGAEGRVKKAESDIFGLGCVIFFLITNGRHPFGDDPSLREHNIKQNNIVNLSLLKDFPEAFHLLSHMLSPLLNYRPSAMKVLKQPLMWKSRKKQAFLCDTSDLGKNNSLLSDSLEASIIEGVSNTCWNQNIHEDIITHMRNYHRYDFASVRSLLRFIRNMSIHYKQLSPHIMNLIGVKDRDDLFDGYFARLFPNLFMMVYKLVEVNCSEERGFKEYF